MALDVVEKKFGLLCTRALSPSAPRKLPRGPRVDEINSPTCVVVLVLREIKEMLNKRKKKRRKCEREKKSQTSQTRYVDRGGNVTFIWHLKGSNHVAIYSLA